MHLLNSKAGYTGDWEVGHSRQEKCLSEIVSSQTFACFEASEDVQNETLGIRPLSVKGARACCCALVPVGVLDLSGCGSFFDFSRFVTGSECY